MTGAWFLPFIVVLAILFVFLPWSFAFVGILAVFVLVEVLMWAMFGERISKR